MRIVPLVGRSPVFPVCFSCFVLAANFWPDGSMSPKHAPQLSLVLRKLVFGVSDQVPHKPGCAIIEYG